MILHRCFARPLAVAAIISAGLVACRDKENAEPAPVAAAPKVDRAAAYQAARASTVAKLAEIRAFLRESTKGLADLPVHAQKPCPKDLAARAPKTWDEVAFILTDDSLDFFTDESPKFPAEGAMGFRPGPPAWTARPSAGVALAGRGAVVLDALESLAYVEPKFGQDLMQTSGIAANKALLERFGAMPELLILYRSQGDVGSKVVAGEGPRTNPKTGAKSVTIKGGGSGGQVAVLDARSRTTVCAFSVSASDTGGYGSSSGRIASAVIAEMEAKLGKGLYKPR